MMKNALIFQGWYQNSNTNWYPWLRKELEKRKFKVNVPDLPTMHTDKPSLKRQLSHIYKDYNIDKNTFLFGHSLGSLLALRIAEKKKFKKMFLVSGWDFNDLTKEHSLFWRNPVNHSRIKNNVKNIYCVSSDNDPYITAFQCEEMCKRLGGKFILVKGAGHFTKKEGTTKINKLLEHI